MCFGTERCREHGFSFQGTQREKTWKSRELDTVFSAIFSLTQPPPTFTSALKEIHCINLTFFFPLYPIQCLLSRVFIKAGKGQLLLRWLSSRKSLLHHKSKNHYFQSQNFQSFHLCVIGDNVIDDPVTKRINPTLSSLWLHAYIYIQEKEGKLKTSI